MASHNFRGSDDKAKSENKMREPLIKANDQAEIQGKLASPQSKVITRRLTKHAHVVAMLRSSSGAIIASIMSATVRQQRIPCWGRPKEA